jgi:hypothetical membrane protein
LAGILSPIVLVSATVQVAWQRPEYSHLRQTMSELGTAGTPHAAWMNWAGIVPAGVLVAVAARALRDAFGRGGLGRLASGVLMLAGSSFVVAGAFPWVGSPGDLLSTSSRIHLVAAIAGFIGLALAPLLFGLQARRTGHAHDWFLPSIIAGTAVFMLAFWPDQGGYGGAFQRASLAVFYSWLVAGSVWTLRHRRS